MIASPLEVPTIYIKDKQAFAKSEGVMRLLGPAVECMKNLAKKYKLFHIVDLDLKKGNATNFDIYDKLTYFTHIQVECENEEAADRLTKIMVRLVIRLPTKLSLKWNKKLMVGEIDDINNLKELEKQIEKVGDIIISDDIIARSSKKANNNDKIVEILKKTGKRIMIKNPKKQKDYSDVWAIILPEP